MTHEVLPITCLLWRADPLVYTSAMNTRFVDRNEATESSIAIAIAMTEDTERPCVEFL